MPPKQPVDVETLLRRLSKTQQTIEREDATIYQKIERFDKIFRLLIFMATGLIGLAVLMATVQWDIASIKAELERRNIIVDRVNEMWFMKQHGISNSQAYKEATGKNPPGQ